MHGTVTDCGEGRLRLELSSAGGTWDHHSAVSTTGDGAFSFSIAPADTRVGTRVGTYRWRVIGEFDGRTTTLDQDDVLRVGVMRAHNAGSKFAGERTNAWGVFPGPPTLRSVARSLSTAPGGSSIVPGPPRPARSSSPPTTPPTVQAGSDGG